MKNEYRIRERDIVNSDNEVVERIYYVQKHLIFGIWINLHYYGNDPIHKYEDAKYYFDMLTGKKVNIVLNTNEKTT